MKISPQSWHWQLFKKYFSARVWQAGMAATNRYYHYKPLSLCEYFWGVVWCLVRSAWDFLFTWPVRPATLGVLIFCLYVVPIYTFWLLRLSGFFSGLLLVIFAVGLCEVIVTGATILVGGCWLLMKFIEKSGLENYSPSHFVDKILDSETVNLVAAYVKAKKQRVCPILEIPKED